MAELAELSATIRLALDEESPVAAVLQPADLVPAERPLPEPARLEPVDDDVASGLAAGELRAAIAAAKPGASSPRRRLRELFGS